MVMSKVVTFAGAWKRDAPPIESPSPTSRVFRKTLMELAHAANDKIRRGGVMEAMVHTQMAIVDEILCFLYRKPRNNTVDRVQNHHE